MPQVGEIKKGLEIGRDPKYPWKKYIWRACIDCGEERWVALLYNKPVHSRCKKCSRRGKFHPNYGHRGAGSTMWRDGKYKGKDGYMRIYLYPNDFFYPMATKGGYVLEHRLVMAKHLSRCLLSWELVHHKNGIRNDNRIENLKLLTRVYHLPDMHIKALVKRQQKQIKELQQRVTLLEAENVLLRTQMVVV